MFATISAVYVLFTFIIFSLILSVTQAFDITNALSVSVYGAVDESSKSDEAGEDSTIVDCKKGYQQKGNKCVSVCSDYYGDIKQECTDFWAGGGGENTGYLPSVCPDYYVKINPECMDASARGANNTSDMSIGNATTHRLGTLNFSEIDKQ